MKKLVWLIMLTPMLIILLPGCGNGRKLTEATEFTFERENGSLQGEQLYVCINREQIVSLRYFSPESGAAESLEGLPITKEGWQRITALLEKLELKRERAGLLEKLFPKQDGSDSRRLTVRYGEKSVDYTVIGDSLAFEDALEKLIAEAVALFQQNNS